MSVFRRLKLSPAMVIACVALAIALGGTSYAAVQRLPKNSVTTYQVKDFSLLARDFKRGQLPAGPAGPTGPTGPAGPAGPAGPSGSANVKWALVRADGGIVAQSGGITLAAKPGTGRYILNMGALLPASRSSRPAHTQTTRRISAARRRRDRVAGPARA